MYMHIICLCISALLKCERERESVCVFYHLLIGFCTSCYEPETQLLPRTWLGIRELGLAAIGSGCIRDPTP